MSWPPKCCFKLKCANVVLSDIFVAGNWIDAPGQKMKPTI
jgi:hypothetical protein